MELTTEQKKAIGYNYASDMNKMEYRLSKLGIYVPALYIEGLYLFSCQDVCELIGRSSKGNSSAWIREHIPEKWVVRLFASRRHGECNIYVTEPGFYYALFKGKSDIAKCMVEDICEALNIGWFQ